MDRIDMHIDVQRVAPGAVLSTEGGTSSEELRCGVMAAREYASWRRAREQVGSTTQDLMESCHLEQADADFFERMAALNHMSGRAIVRTISVARTIADMAQRRAVCKADICEALSFRLREGVGQ